jgi:hypothetical protein
MGQIVIMTESLEARDKLKAKVNEYANGYRRGGDLSEVPRAWAAGRQAGAISHIGPDPKVLRDHARVLAG